MTIDFSAGDPGVQAGEETNFTGQGEQGEGASGADDQTVVLEIGDRKFTKADLVKKITNADQHIATLTGELAEQRNKLDTLSKSLEQSMSAAEVLKRIQEQQQGNPGSAAAGSESSSEQQSNVAVDPKSITDQVLKQLEAASAAKQGQANWESVTAKLTQAFGTAVNDKVREAAVAHKLSIEKAAELARTNPELFLKMFDLNKPAGTQIGRGGVNTAAFKEKPAKSSGYSQARSTNDQVDAFQKRLKERLSN